MLTHTRRIHQVTQRSGRNRPYLALLGSLALLTACGGSGPSGERPWADRPVVELRFDVASDLTSVSGHERVVFTADLDTCELVFRAWPNKPATARAGSSLTVSAARVDGADAEVRDVAAGAPSDAAAGTLLQIPLEDCMSAGDTRTVDLDFTVGLGEDVDERVGTSSSTSVAWFGTAFPLLAWERGRGWAQGSAVPLNGETVTSEDFTLRSLEVAAPSGFDVLGTGRAVGTEDGPDGTTVHRFTASAVRDVAVTVGDLDTAERTIDGVRVHVGLDRSVRRSDAEDWLDRIAESEKDLTDLLGPFPYRDLWVSVLSSQSSGIEFPGAVQFGDVDPAERYGLVDHELAHMWFYGLVGNDQGEHPWLDESFATFAQEVVDDDVPSGGSDRSDGAAAIGGSMASWLEFRHPDSAYYDTVYLRGAAVLREARDRAGPEAFDEALRAYVRANAYSIATPDDVRAAFADLPGVVSLLEEDGALQ